MSSECSHNFWLEQGQKNTRIAETGNTIGETFYEDIAHRQIFSLNENCFCHFKSWLNGWKIVNKKIAADAVLDCTH